MTSLIAALGKGKGTWPHVKRLIEEEEWEKIFLVTDDFGVKNFQAEKELSYIAIDKNRYMSQIKQDIKGQLKGKIPDTEVALNIVSGDGKLHMALLSAVISSGLGIRIVTLTPEGIKEL